MAHPGRKSAAELALNPVSPRLTRLRSPRTLSESEAALFEAIVGNCAANHFRDSDVPMRFRYVEAAVLSERAGQELRQAPIVEGKPSPWLAIREKAVREMVALSMRLRLSPQARKGHAMADPKPLTFSDQVRLRNGGSYYDRDDADAD
jgi:hypothetical protein